MYFLYYVLLYISYIVELFLLARSSDGHVNRTPSGPISDSGCKNNQKGQNCDLFGH